MNVATLRRPAPPILLLVLLAAAPAGAQVSGDRVETFPTTTFVDKTFGFEMRVPAGWKYDRTAFFGPGESLGLLRGAAPAGRQTLQILVFRQVDQASFSDWVEFFARQLGSISGTLAVRVKGVDLEQRPAAYVVADAKLGIDRTRTYYYCVQFDPGLIWVFSFAQASRAGLAGDNVGELKEVTIPPWLQRLCGSLRIFYSAQKARELADALARGRKFLAAFGLEQVTSRLKPDGVTRYYEILIDGELLGYMTRQVRRGREPLQHPGAGAAGKPGLLVHERSYLFPPDGAIVVARTDLFSSNDGLTDLYEISEARIPPAQQNAAIHITRDQCVREGQTLFSTFTTSSDRGLPPPRRPLKLDESFLGLAWARVLPGLLGEQAKPALGFTIYDTETRALITQTVEFLGRRPLPQGSGTALCFRIQAGFAEHAATVYTDAAGNLLRFEAGGMVLRLSSAAAIEQRFAKQRREVQQRLERHGSPLRP